MATTTGNPFPTSDQPPRSSMGGSDNSMGSTMGSSQRRRNHQPRQAGRA